MSPDRRTGDLAPLTTSDSVSLRRFALWLHRTSNHRGVLARAFRISFARLVEDVAQRLDANE